jgi:site-specific DNA-cytosine methylase
VAVDRLSAIALQVERFYSSMSSSRKRCEPTERIFQIHASTIEIFEKSTGRRRVESTLGRSDSSEQVGLGPKQLDILDGSPPCKSFSQAGRGEKPRHERVEYSDTSQSGVDTLFYDFFYLAKRVLPKVIVAENVPSLANAKNNALFEEFLSSMRHFRHLSDRSQDILAYYANYMVLDASLFGVPQKRNRLFIIGIRKDVAHKVGIRSHEAVRAVFPSPPNTIVTIRGAFEGLDQSELEIDQWRAGMRESDLLHPTMRLPRNPPKTIKLPKKEKPFQLVRPSWDVPCPTLTQAGQKLRGRAGVLHPGQDRKFTLSELKRLFAVPDDYVITGSVDQRAERICRMVSPLVSKAIAKSIFEKVILPYRTAGK